MSTYYLSFLCVIFDLRDEIYDEVLFFFIGHFG